MQLFTTTCTPTTQSAPPGPTFPARCPATRRPRDLLAASLRRGGCSTCTRALGVSAVDFLRICLQKQRICCCGCSVPSRRNESMLYVHAGAGPVPGTNGERDGLGVWGLEVWGVERIYCPRIKTTAHLLARIIQLPLVSSAQYHRVQRNRALRDITIHYERAYNKYQQKDVSPVLHEQRVNNRPSCVIDARLLCSLSRLQRPPRLRPRSQELDGRHFLPAVRNLA